MQKRKSNNKSQLQPETNTITTSEPKFVLEVLVDDAVMIAPDTQNAFRSFINGYNIPFGDERQARAKFDSVRTNGLKIYDQENGIVVSFYPAQTVRRLTIFDLEIFTKIEQEKEKARAEFAKELSKSKLPWCPKCAESLIKSEMAKIGLPPSDFVKREQQLRCPNCGFTKEENENAQAEKVEPEMPYGPGSAARDEYFAKLPFCPKCAVTGAQSEMALGEIMTTIPAKQEIKCPNCGFTSVRLIEKPSKKKDILTEEKVPSL